MNIQIEQESFRTYEETGKAGGKAVYAIEYDLRENGCHICVSHRPAKSGYPRIRVNKKLMLMHRYIWEKYNGVIPANLCVCHKCDERMCINPDHLFLGTIADNNRDMYEKGRNHKATPEEIQRFVERTRKREPMRGSLNGNARLTESQVAEIRARANESGTLLAREFHVDRKLIYLIIRNEVWKHVR